MLYFIYNSPLFSSKSGTWVLVKDLIKQPNLTVAVLGFNDKYLSVDGNGDWNWSDTVGKLESASLNDSVIVFNPVDGANGVLYPYPLLKVISV